MRRDSFRHFHAQSIVAALTFLTGAGAAIAADGHHCQNPQQNNIFGENS